MPHVSPRTILDGRVAYAYVEDISVTVFDVPTWTDESVVRLMEETTRLGEYITAKGALSQFHGEVFHSHHRKVILSWLERQGLTASPRNVLLTDSALMRGALTAFAWLTQSETRAFDPNERAAACAFVTHGFVATPGAVEAAYVQCCRLLGRPVAHAS